jgi:hypothetical protein
MQSIYALHLIQNYNFIFLLYLQMIWKSQKKSLNLPLQSIYALQLLHNGTT